MPDELKILLEKIENANPRNRPKASVHKDDLKEQIAPDLIQNFIKMAYQSDLIRDAGDLLRQNEPDINDNTVYILSIKGFEYLNQTRIKEAIEKFNMSSDKSSKTIELYNARLVNLTLLLVVLTIALLVIPPDAPSSERYIGILFIVGMVLILFPLKKKSL
ncbi:MAG: hypothetical protein Q7J35_03190 [Candidatus Methanoperedens sp.]|nr:hypothetical protein [Candidatus Methanoperedens sp.]